MILGNIAPRSAELFTELTSDIEEAIGREFILFNGFGDRFSMEYLEEMHPLADNQDKIPVVFFSPPLKCAFDYAPRPAFAIQHNLYRMLNNSSASYIDVDSDCIGEDKLVGPLLSPSGALYGHNMIINDREIAFIYYNFLNNQPDDFWKAAVKYLLQGVASAFGEYPYQPFEFDCEPVSDVDERIKDLVRSLTEKSADKERELKRTIDSYRREMAAKYKKLREVQYIMAGYENASDLKAQMEIAVQNPHVAWIDIQDGNIVFMMTDITIMNPKDDTIRDIGNIVVTVRPEDSKVFFDNVTRKCRGIGTVNSSHPHDASGGDGEMCLGEISHAVPQLVSEFEIAPLTELLVNFAKSVNIEDSAGKYIREWPLVEQN